MSASNDEQHPRRRRLGGWASCLALAATTLGTPAPATATNTKEIPLITLTKSGPAKAFPVRTAFRLGGEVDAKTIRVTPVFIRYMFRPWGLNPKRKKDRPAWARTARPSGCSEILDVLEGAHRDSDPRHEAIASRAALVPGQHEVEEIWPSPMPRHDPKDATRRQVYEHLRLHAQVMIPRSWEALPTKDEAKRDFEILVADPAFFRPGARYCMLLYHDVAEVNDATALIKRKIMSVAVKRANECANQSAPPLSCTILSAHRNEVDKELRKLLAGTKDVDTLVDRVRDDLLGNAVQMRFHGERVARLLNGFKFIVEDREANGDLIRRWSPPESAAAATGKFGAFVAEALGQHGTIRIIEGNSRTYAFNDFAVNFIKIVGTDPQAVVLEDPSSPDPNKQSKLSLDLDEVRMPGGRVSLEDVLAFAQGRIRLDGGALDTEALSKFADEHIALDALGTDTRPIGEVSAKALDPPPGQAKVRALRDRIGALESLLDEALAARKTADNGSPGGRDARLLQLLGIWLYDEVLIPCNQHAVQQMGALVSCAGNDNPWHGYAKGSDPLSTLQTELENYAVATDNWVKEKKVLDRSAIGKASIDPVTFNVSLSTDLDQGEWLSTYVTPYFGLSGVMTGEESFGLFYSGVQIYLWPNEIHEPMWVNGGADVRRIFAFELGLGIPGAGSNATRFGPGDRYRSFTSWKMPPVFTGVALQPLPYTTLSMGLSQMRQARSPITAEIPQRIRAFYVGITLDVNFFNYLRQRLSGFPSAIPTVAGQ